MRRFLFATTAVLFVGPALADGAAPIPDGLTLSELHVMVPLIDAGIKATGVQVFQDGKSGSALQSALNKLAKMEQAQQAAPQTPESKP